MEEQTVIPQLIFDYGALDDGVRATVVDHTQAIHRLARRSAGDIIEIGEHLLAVKQHVGHGHFTEWLTAEFGWTDRTARRFMQVAERFKTDNLSDLPAPSVLYLLAQPNTPTEVVDAVLERTADGEKVSVAEVRDAIRDQQARVPIGVLRSDETGEITGAAYYFADAEDVQADVSPADDPIARARAAAKLHPSVRWPEAMTKLYDFMIGARQAGGFAAMVCTWSPEARQSSREAIQRIVAELSEWERILEQAEDVA